MEEFFQRIVDFFNSPLFRLLSTTTRVFVFALYASMVYWTYRDAKRRGALASYWAIVVLIFNVFGLFIYLVLRPPDLIEEAKGRELEIKAMEAAVGDDAHLCPACKKPVDKDFLICPSCLKRLKKACPECQRALTLSWTVCPYCQNSL